MNEPMTLRARVAAPIDDVWRALTDGEQIRTWLAEHAEVDLPDQYAFWGRYTPEGEAPHQTSLQAGDHTLRFGWFIDNTDTVVQISLAEEGPRLTAVTLTQSGVPEWGPDTSPLQWLRTFWTLSIANLVDHLDGRDLTPKVDFTSAVMRTELVIDAAPDVVYDSLVDPGKVTRWFGVRVEFEPSVGSRWALGGFDVDPEPATIRELEPGRKLSVAWSAGVAITWELEDLAGRTRLSFVQSGFDEGQPPFSAWAAWLGGLAELRRFHELSDWQPMWLDVYAQGEPETQEV